MSVKPEGLLEDVKKLIFCTIQCKLNKCNLTPTAPLVTLLKRFILFVAVGTASQGALVHRSKFPY